ncbi:HoxN/HupN/NixA family nickel/cobalt transporter [Alicyclobacillus fastidiosus]|uniref:Nickel/cobalt efflux system n=1 Tax=Alicyclobacillus fastidiosus TaxID=392011 RepID=A0ABY6ZIB2_9BACL|nr:HoxN/HupN/NixA family nickel/cobalt transporter [Alicyclobacillus fastidiosus]WAH42505.1 HoxN/HupN/NixA family nickel/cobalt transporter [Alicyclobacillus fastidiosus]GMA64344.1 HoxN/HupN/NixA family nickel/cobalt transporter [Alicyclobacillus fastidiosus]
MNFKKSILEFGLSIVVLHVVAIGLLVTAIPHHPTLLGLGVLAYTFGLRHAFDADHIAAIDNTVRKLRQEEKNPIGVGFYFSLGHSTIVIIMAIVTAFAVHWAQKSIPALQNIGGILGTSISAVFLFLIGIINLFVLMNIYKVFKEMRTTSLNEAEFEEVLLSRGFISRMIGPLFKLVNKSWHIYPIGVLFGFSFDTASEVALLAISAGAAKNAIPFTGVLALPLLFSAGMSLMDTADGLFMTTAYHWAFATPIRKVYYNLTVTGLSVVAALVIGMIEVLQVLAPEMGLNQGFWAWVQNLDFGTIGCMLVGMFVVTWTVSYGIWKFYRIEQRWSATN